MKDGIFSLVAEDSVDTQYIAGIFEDGEAGVIRCVNLSGEQVGASIWLITGAASFPTSMPDIERTFTNMVAAMKWLFAMIPDAHAFVLDHPDGMRQAYEASDIKAML